MGLFSGGGFLGSVGQAFGINTSAQEKAIGRATKQSIRGIEQGIEAIEGSTEAALTAQQPFFAAGQQGLQDFSGGATLQGFGGNLQDIFSSGALDPLISERQRAAQSALGSAGLTRSGAAATSAANIPAELAFQIEALLSGRQQNLAGIGQQAAGNISNIEQLSGSNIAAARTNQGQVTSSGTLGTAQAKQAGLENIAGLISSSLGAAGSAGLLGTGGGAQFLGALSDMRLKTNIRPLGTVGDLTLCEWDWLPDVEELISDDMPLMTCGFIAQEVAEKYPQFSGDYHGFKTIDYDGLIKELTCLH